ncbi:MAG: aminotransferase class V-fold PLP-dependent enzyme [Pseudomonadota bacterium]
MNRMFPLNGRAWDELSEELEARKSDDIPWHEGRTHATAFHASDDVLDVVKAAYGMYLTENGLYAGRAFPSVGGLESEIIAMLSEFLGGDRATSGIITSGGSDSIMTAVRAAREWAKAERPDIARPTVLLAQNAHPGFNKAADYLGLQARRVPLGTDLRADSERMAEAIDGDTIMLVGSAPAWPYGMMDPIEDLAALAERNGLWFHVDACVGGMIAPFVRAIGREVPHFDLRIPGVTSLSADLHKYGYAAKNVSAVLFRDTAHRDFAHFAFEDWPAGSYATYTTAGSRTAGSLAGAWTVLNYLGEDGYKNFARVSMDARDRMIDGIERLGGMQVIGAPEVTLFAVTSEEHDLIDIAERMKAMHWYPNRIREPHGLHFVMNPIHAPMVDGFLEALERCIAEAGPKGSTHAEADVRYN